MLDVFTLLCRRGSLILSPHLAKFRVGLVKVEIQRFLFVTWPRYLSVTWLCWWGLLILNHHPARFGAHRSYGTGKKWRLLYQLQFQLQLQCQCRGLQMAHIRLLISFIEKKVNFICHHPQWEVFFQIKFNPGKKFYSFHPGVKFTCKQNLFHSWMRFHLAYM